MRQEAGETLFERSGGLRLATMAAPSGPAQESAAAIPTQPPATVAATQAQEDAGPPPPERRGLALAGWQPPAGMALTAYRRELQARLMRQQGADAARTRLELARLGLAQAQAAEALSWLGDPPAAFDADAPKPAEAVTAALAGAAAALLGREPQATRLLAGADADEAREPALWRALLAGQRGDWDQALRLLEASGQVLSDYPPLLLQRLSPAAARIALEAGRADMALRICSTRRAQRTRAGGCRPAEAGQGADPGRRRPDRRSLATAARPGQQRRTGDGRARAVRRGADAVRPGEQ